MAAPQPKKAVNPLLQMLGLPDDPEELANIAGPILDDIIKPLVERLDRIEAKLDILVSLDDEEGGDDDEG